MNLNYTFGEKLFVRKPVYRIPYLVNLSRGLNVLDIGCYDETALSKRETGQWLHEELIKSANQVIGIDNSANLTGNQSSGSSAMLKLDACDIDSNLLEKYDFDLIIAGELIEHLDNTLGLFKKIKLNFKDKQFACTTPNATSLSNVLLSVFKRESAHKDHLQVYSYKTLNTLCVKAGFLEWEIIPYHVYFTELIQKNRGPARLLFKSAEKAANFAEYLFPLLSGGLILHVRKI